MPSKSQALMKRAKSVRLLAMDVDGVLTSGEIVILNSGEEIKFWNAKDRLILALLSKRKVPLIIAWITGRSSKAVTWAAKDLGVKHVIQGCHDKRKALSKLLQQHKLKSDQAAFIGDDLIDIGALRLSGFSACPKDAVADVKKNAQYVSKLPGGRGVVRDVIEYILKAQKKWNPLLEPFYS